jgi:MOSC domain-containing protein YiiM
MSLLRGTVVSVSRNDVYSFTKPVRDEIVLVAGIGVEGDVHAGVNVRHRSRVKADPTQPNLRQVHLIHEELFAQVGDKGYTVEPGNLGENVTTSGVDLLGLPLGSILRFGPPVPAEAAEQSAGAVSGSAALAEVLAAAASATLNPRTAAAAAAVEAAAARSDAAATRKIAAGGNAVAGNAVAGNAVAGNAAAGNAAADSAAGNAAAGGYAGTSAGGDGAPASGDVASGEGAVDLRPAVIVAGLRNPCAQINGFRSGLLKEVVGPDEDGNLVRKGGVMGVVLRGGSVRPGDVISVELPPGPHTALEYI